MKKIQELLSHEKPMSPRILLYREGIFYRAYEYSAYYFHRHIRPEYRMHKRRFRNIGRDVIYIGFPSKVLPRLLEGKGCVSRDPSLTTGELVVLRLDHPPIDEEELRSYKETVISSRTAGARKQRPADLAERICSIDLCETSPQELVALVRELQEQCRTGADRPGRNAVAEQ